MLDGMRSGPPYCDVMLGDGFILKSIAWNIEKITFALIIVEHACLCFASILLDAATDAGICFR